MNTKSKIKNSVGRPSKYSEDIIKQLLTVIEIGGTLTTAFEVIGVNETTYYEWCKLHPELNNRVSIARGIAKAGVIDCLGKSIRKGNIDAIKFWLKNRARDEWNETNNINAIISSSGEVVSDEVKKAIEDIDSRDESERLKIIDAIRKLADK
jgi:hypothetical protein